MKVSVTLSGLFKGLPLDQASDLEGKPVRDINGKVIGTVSEVDLEHDFVFIDLVEEGKEYIEKWL